MSFNIHNGKVYPKGIIGEDFKVRETKIQKPKGSFKDILTKEIGKNEGLSFSKHASMRLKERNIDISADDMEKLNNALDKAEKKGCRDSVLIYKNNGFITSVKNKKIITVCEMEKGDGIVTNVDSVLFV